MGLLLSYLIIGVILWPFSYWYFVKQRGSSKGLAFIQGIGVAIAIVIMLYFLVQVVQQTSSTLPAPPTASAIPPAQKTSTSYHSPTSTPRDYSVIQSILIKPGDLPTEYTAGGVMPSLTSNLLKGKIIPNSDYSVSQEIKKKQSPCCVVTVICSKEYAIISALFDLSVDGMSSPTLSDPPQWVPGLALGSRAAYDSKNLVFRGARYLVIIEGIPYNFAYPYAIDLQDRLNALGVCGSY